MASQVQISTYQAGVCPEASGELSADSRKLGVKASTDAARGIVAHSFEFVALPGRAENIQLQIPTAMRHAFNSVDGFMGCMVLISVQESRLVTVVTLWTGLHRSELCGESVKRLQKWLSPYVDRWLRSRRFASFVAVPDRFPSNSCKLCEMPLGASCSHLQ